MITGDWIGTDVVGTGHTYPAGSMVGISDDDSPSVATDYGPPANPSIHRWRVNLPSLAGQLVKAGKDWRAYLNAGSYRCIARPWSQAATSRLASFRCVAVLPVTGAARI
jgi:hypothetical protein